MMYQHEHAPLEQLRHEFDLGATGEMIPLVGAFFDMLLVW